LKISIVIATYNRVAILARTLPTVLDQDFPAHQREVIVVDDGSTDATADYLRTAGGACRMAVIQRPHRGPAAARNAGIFAAAGDLLLLLDDDMLCGRSLVGGHVAAHRGQQAVVVFGPIALASESPDTTALMRLKSHPDRNTAGRGDAPVSKYQAWATNCSMPRRLALAQGGYDETLLTHEDADLAIRLWEAGARFQFEPALAIRELYDKPAHTLIKGDARLLGRGEVRLCRKHPGYLPYSRVAHLSKFAFGPWFIRAACRLPFSAQPLLGPIQYLAQRLPGASGSRMATHILKCRMAIEELRAMVEECGSWRCFQERFAVYLGGAPVTRPAQSGASQASIPEVNRG
jgi:glycosyltransferase involved in cell wall biosynthesis